jgi:hypothetical protein
MDIVTAHGSGRLPSMVKAVAKKDSVFATDHGHTSTGAMTANRLNRLTSREAPNVYESLHMEPETVGHFEPVTSRDPGRIADL